MALELWTRPKLLISILNYINSLATVVYTTSFPRRFSLATGRYFKHHVRYTASDSSVCSWNNANSRSHNKTENTARRDMRIKAVKRFQCILWCQTSNKRRRRMRRVKQHHKSDCCFYSTHLALTQPGYVLAQARTLYVSKTNGRDITVSSYLPLVTSRFASDLFS